MLKIGNLTLYWPGERALHAEIARVSSIADRAISTAQEATNLAAKYSMQKGLAEEALLVVRGDHWELADDQGLTLDEEMIIRFVETREHTPGQEANIEATAYLRAFEVPHTFYEQQAPVNARGLKWRAESISIDTDYLRAGSYRDEDSYLRVGLERVELRLRAIARRGEPKVSIG